MKKISAAILALFIGAFLAGCTGKAEVKERTPSDIKKNAGELHRELERQSK